jgi:hypothetical protein
MRFAKYHFSKITLPQKYLYNISTYIDFAENQL